MACYEDGRFGAFICSHVLEHVADDLAAVRELWRVLEPGGWGIVMVPVHLKSEEIDERPTSTEAERWQLFGQGDHVRLYSKSGLVSRLEAAGFRVLQLGREYFGQERMRRFGLAASSVLYVVEKPVDVNLSSAGASRI